MLEEARRHGFLGPGPVEAHLEHADGFASAVRTHAEGAEAWSLRRAADLGSGGGVPGLPLALAFPHCRWALVESGVRRAELLRRALADLGVEARVEVAQERAEVFGRAAGQRGSFDLVVARSFGPPAVVAECAAPLLRVGGIAVVSEPPGGDPGRWPVTGLRLLGMSPATPFVAQGRTYQILVQDDPCPERYPRRVGVPAKRPLF